MGARDGTCGFDVELRDGRTVIEVTGGQAAVAVRSESGERLYLPPDRADRRHADRGEGNEPPTEGDQSEEGRAVATPDGIRVVHPEPVIDFRLLR